ncbi:MAG: GTP-binding protein [Saprospiraceae bacterium]|nr:GTP-binding protein [Saprospiraceae bacterium]
MLSKKIILTGSLGVGKTSLFNQFLYQRFDEKYLTTIGVKVDKKTVMVNGRELSLLVWDIAGEIKQDKVPRTYFLGSSALIYVFDLTRPTTYSNMLEDLKYLKMITPGVVIRVIGNKIDLVDLEKLNDILDKVPATIDFTTSAKTGENVENVFFSIGEELLDNA